MAECIVDLLEVIEVHQHQRDLPIITGRGCNRLSEAVLEERPVWQARQWIGRGERVQTLNHLSRFRGVLHQSIDADHIWASRADGSAIGPVLVGMLLGLAMVRRVDPDTITDDMAVAALCSVVGPDAAPATARSNTAPNDQGATT